jgi:hypothetical protein
MHHRPHLAPLSAVATAAILILAACGGPRPLPWTDATAYIDITSDAGFVFSQAGDTATISAVVRRRSDGSVIPNAQVTFASSADGVVSVHPVSGTLTVHAGPPRSAVISAAHGQLTPAIAAAAVAVLAPATVFVAYDEFIRFDRDTGELILRRGVLSEGLVPGHVLLSGDRAGLLDRVVAIEIQHDRVVVMTEPADLTDAFDELDVEVEGPLVEFEAVFGAAGLTVYDQRGAVVATSAFGFTCEAEMGTPVEVIFTGSSIAQTVQLAPAAHVKITRAGYASATVDLFELSATGLVRLTAQSGSIEIAAGISGTITCERSTSNIPLAFIPIVGPLGAAPTVTPSVGFDLAAEANAGRFKVTGPSVDEGVSTTMGIRYRGASGGSFSAFSTSARIGNGLSWGAYESDLRAEFKATVQPFVKGTVNISANLAQWSIADFGFSEAKVYGGVDLEMHRPFEHTEVGYLGPRWGFFVGAYGGLDPLFEKINEFQKFINRVGIGVAVTGFDAELFEVEVPLLTQPEPQVGVSPARVPFGKDATFSVSQARAGRTAFIGYRLDDHGKPTAGVAVADITVGDAGTGNGSWTPREADGGEYHVRAMSFHGPFGAAGFPYASANLVAFEVGDGAALRIDPSQLLGGVIGQSYEFELIASDIPEGITTVTFEWSFGQGAPGLATQSVVGGGASTRIANSYTTPGSYTIAASLRDGAGDLATASAPVDIEGVVVAIDPPVLQGEVDTSYAFSFTAVGLPVSLANVVFEWNLGSGVGATGSQIVEVRAGKATWTVQHTYPATGAFGVFLAVRDEANRLGNATAVVRIGEVPDRDEDLTACETWKVSGSGGFGVTVDAWDISTIPAGALFDISYDALNVPDTFVVEYPSNSVVLDTGWRGSSNYDGNPNYPGGVTSPGEGRKSGMFTKTGIQSFKVTVLGGQPGTVWNYSIRCRVL